jgi:phosphotransferase system enzyme I (PtsI)
MSKTVAERRWHGRAASPGLAAGPVFVLDGVTAGGAPGEADCGAPALARAIQAAIDEIAVLEAALPEAEAEILAFQRVMLEDAELAAPAYAGIDAGRAAVECWRAAIDAEAAAYRAGDDAYFQARAADLDDLGGRVARHLTGTAMATPPPGAIVVAGDLPPSLFLATDWTQGGGIALSAGSPSSHVAMLARARGVPMVVGLGDLAGLAAGTAALLDAESGDMVADPAAASLAGFEERCRAAATVAAAAASRDPRAPTVTACGTPVAMSLNIADVAELDSLDPAICDGIGLVRTEFLFERSGGLPDEASQYAAYRRLAEWAQGRPVVIRTLDAGGDKPMAGVTLDNEANPFLGTRGLRLSLRRPELFGVQLRALARAAMHGDIRVMLPMVTVPGELEQARALLHAAVAALAADCVAARLPSLGIMVEVPSAAIAVERFDAAFFSIGSNDLVQYVTAVSRDIGALADLADPCDPAVLYLLRHVVRHGAARGVPVSLCGDAAGDPAVIGALLNCGLRGLSVAPSRLARAKLAVAKTRIDAS